MYILGIACFYHDSSAALLKDGVVVAAVQEERWTRKKHDTSFPINAIKYCLTEAGITIKEVDFVAFYEKPLLKFERLLQSHLETFPRSLSTFIQAMPSWASEKLRIPSTLSKKCGYKGEVYYIEHHLTHAAASFLSSPFEEAAILTVDGVGEWATTTLGVGKGNSITLLKEIHFPHSLGLLYSTLTAYLGFKVNSHEYKVMGLAPYGEPRYYDKLRHVIDIKEDGSYQLDMSYFVYHYKDSMHSKKFEKEFGPARKREEPVEQRHKDMAASLQKLLEEAYFKMLRHLQELTGLKKVCLGGGVALNSVANGKITSKTLFKDVYVPCAPSDAGSSLGAALALWCLGFGQKRPAPLETAYLGPSYSEEYIEHFLKHNKIAHRKLTEKELVRTAAMLLKENAVIGWFQGRMEFGERALGARSILANPCSPSMRDILNLKVKHREQFRPFAPVVTQEDAPTYFESDVDVPFMSFVYPVREEMRPRLPAVTHVDGTGRLQTISKQQNPRYHALLKEFEKLSGVPILVNTSFNIRGEPIVMTPEHAYRCFSGTEIDYLVLENFLIDRKQNQKDWWDSEKTIVD
jgi:carbamoyltransferase